jgi:PEP-CTERM motif
MIIKGTRIILFTAVTLLGLLSISRAATLFTFNGDCSGGANCFGSTYTLIIGDANDANSTTYTAALIIDTAGYNGGQAFIDAVDVKVVNSLISNTFALTLAPGGAANWQTTFNTGQAATDCGSGGGFFICARDPDPNDLAPVGGILEWDWTFSSNDSIAFGHIGASYNNAAGTVEGQNTSISNATGTPGGKIPEPSALILLGSGLLVVGGLVRKFRKKN